MDDDIKIGGIYASKTFPFITDFYLMPLVVDKTRNLVYYRYLSNWEEERVESIDRFLRGIKLAEGENDVARYGRR